jgi:ABC-type sugar transport system ATPase subunit
MALGDRIAVMNDGRIEQLAAPAEIYSRPVTRFVAEFFGSQGMNFCRSDDRVLGARPEDIRLASDGLNDGVKIPQHGN